MRGAKSNEVRKEEKNNREMWVECNVTGREKGEIAEC